MHKVLHITYSPFGGAGKAAQNLSRAIDETTSWDSKILNFHPDNLWLSPFVDMIATSTAAIDEFVVKKPRTLDTVSLFRKSTTFSKSNISQIEEADIIHLHWIEGLLHGDFLEALMGKKEGTVFVTLHDMRPFTGACHYAGDCQGFSSGCSSCPIVRPMFQHLVREEFVFRKDFFNRLKPVFIAPGHWMKERFLESFLRDQTCYVVPNVVSEGFFTKLEKPKGDGPLLLGFMAAKLTDPRKGLEIARKQIHRLADLGIELNIQLVGGSPPDKLASWEQYKGILGGNDVSKWLATLDFLVFSSFSDNTPLVLAEALAAGTPILIAKGTGADHMVSLGQDSLDLFNITIDELREEQLRRNLSKGAKAAGKKYAPSQVARQIVGLYEDKIKPKQTAL